MLHVFLQQYQVHGPIFVALQNVPSRVATLRYVMRLSYCNYSCKSSHRYKLPGYVPSVPRFPVRVWSISTQIFSMEFAALPFQLPQLSGRQWFRFADTVLPSPNTSAAPGTEVAITTPSYFASSRSAVILVSKPAL
ncbi:hypothetical protein [Terriglobus albidus]|uniref:hypothetical protein n=1 Tax=Terriglobus albidus TaxID=1592106 RepID=UPI0021E0DFCB|nr:hypothetical protein [Terriglobus albidus]